MNTKNNKRKRESQRKIETAFIELLQEKELNQISVIAICKKANLNDLHELYADEEKNHQNTHNFLKLFYHIKENKLFYKTYFKLGLDVNFKPSIYDKKLAKDLYNEKHIDYHIEYSKAGITAIIKHWLNNNCDISPEELFEILKDEYKDKSFILK